MFYSSLLVNTTYLMPEDNWYSCTFFSGDVVKDLRAPIYGKSRIVMDTFYIKNGIFYHPSKTDKLSWIAERRYAFAPLLSIDICCGVTSFKPCNYFLP